MSSQAADALFGVMDGKALLDALVSSSHDCAMVIDGEGIVVASNGRCVCGSLPCVDAPEGLRPGSDASLILGADLLDRARSARRLRSTTTISVHGSCDRAEATLTILPGREGLMLLSIRDLTESALEAERNLVLANEMRHRLGNTYAIAMAILSSSAKEDDPIGTALRRLGALCDVQSLARQSAGMSLSTMASAIGTTVAGEDVVAHPPAFDAMLGVSQAQAILLVTGELCANSLKHGALRHGGGVEIAWRRTADGIAMDWTEGSPVPPIRVKRAGASGFRLMSSMMRAVRGSLSDEWLASGLKVTASLPLDPADIVPCVQMG